MDRKVTCALAAAVLAWLPPPTAAADWPQWGGSGRDFSVPDPGLAAAWPPSGLEPLWSQPLGEGYSGIAAVGDRLYTHYSEGLEEVVVALAADSGELVWSHRYVAPRPPGMRLNHGEGPHATPLVAGGRVFAVGTTGRLLALEADSGALVWRHDLWGESADDRLRRGYGASPIAWEDTVIVMVGGDGRGAMALRREDGEIVWHSEGFDGSQSSPILIEVGGAPQLVLFVQDEVVALDPRDGRLIWRHPHKALGPYNITTPLWASDGTLFVSSSYGGGSRLLRPPAGSGPPSTSGTGAATVEQMWHSKRMAIQFTNALRIGDHVYGSTGRGTAMVAALDARSGELAWRDRMIGRANYVAVGARVLALEEDGRLMLVELTPAGPKVLAETQLLESQTWTAPTVAGRRLYVRDRERILAVELPLAGSGP